MVLSESNNSIPVKFRKNSNINEMKNQNNQIYL